jgi:hypothetical protein
MAIAECFFLKGRSTEFAMPTIEVFVSLPLTPYKIALIKLVNTFSLEEN